MKYLCILALLGGSLMSNLCFAQGGADLSALMGDAKIDRGSVSSMIDQMAASGMISAEQAKAAKSELDAKSDGELNLLQQRAMQEVKKGNTAETMMQGQNLNTNALNNPSASTSLAGSDAPSGGGNSDSVQNNTATSSSDTSANAEENKEEAKLKGALDFINKP